MDIIILFVRAMVAFILYINTYHYLNHLVVIIEVVAVDVVDIVSKRT